MYGGIVGQFNFLGPLIAGRILFDCAQNIDIRFDCDSFGPNSGLPRFRSTGKHFYSFAIEL